MLNHSKLRIQLLKGNHKIVVIQSLKKHEKTNEELAFIKAVSQGLADIKEDNMMNLDEAKKRLGIL